MRAAVPYSAELTRSLQADNTYIYFAIALTLLLGIVLYLDTALQLHDKGITPSLQVPQHIEVLGDASLIYSIFRNLIDNAISYATGASRLAIVCKEAESEGRHFYEFLVSDNGPGVEPQHLDHLFERFYRIDKGRSRKLGGTGLGLAIVKNAVATHGGTATAQLTPGGGLTIRFTLARF